MRCDDMIHISETWKIQIPGGSIHFSAADLEFLSGTGRQRHIYDFLWIYPHFLCKIGLDRRTLHPYRALCGRNIRQKLGVIDLGKLHPGRTAGCELGKWLIVRCKPLHKFAGFLHNRHICREICVEHIICAQFPEECYHLSFDKASSLHSESFAQGNPDGW